MKLVQMPIPALEPGEALVKIECSTLCGSDLHTIKGLRQEKCPSILGHESVGRVVALAETAPCDASGIRLAVGDRVTWSTTISCGGCDRCQAGWTQKCRTLSKYGHALAEGRQALCGGLAEYILLRPGTAIVKVPAWLSAEVVSPANCATATVACALRMAALRQGARVLIFGAGMLGLTASAMAKSRFRAHVTVVDPVAERLELAKRFGADRTLPWRREVTEGAEGDAVALLADQLKDAHFDAVLEFSGSVQAVEAAVNHCDIGGRVLLVGTVMPTPHVPIDPEQIVRRCMSIHGVHNYASQDLVAALEFLTTSVEQYPWSLLVERTFSLQEIELAVEYAIASKPIRVAIRP